MCLVTRTVAGAKRNAMHTALPHLVRRMRLVLNCVVALFGLASHATAQTSAVPAISVSGGLLGFDGSVASNGALVYRTFPLLFSWDSHLNEGLGVLGTNWPVGSLVDIHMVGPLNQPGVTPVDRRILKKLSPNAQGAIIVSGFQIPFLDGSVSPPVVIRPGSYQIYAIVPPPSPFVPAITATAKDHINICPMMLPSFKSFVPESLGNWTGIEWYQGRGARTGPFGDTTPEVTDPEWLSVWTDKPVALYGTVTASDAQGDNQPVHVAYHEVPWTHYAHDMNIDLVPDSDYQWVLGTSNLVAHDERVQLGRIEWEWETQNGGTPFSYGFTMGQPNIGLPLWATPTVGDRIYTVGRWVMDNGHPDVGLRTEIHPARMIASIRKRNSAVPIFPKGLKILTRASQVDVYVSGHGGGANQYPDALGDALEDGGKGGGDIWSSLSNADLLTYLDQGPADTTIISAIIHLINDNLDYFGFSNLPDVSGIKSVAGPSGLGWGNGGEFRPVNDMNYDFDVPLPKPPAGAKSIKVSILKHPEDTTLVTQAISFKNPDSNGLPTTAHIHLPYLGADNGVYARTLYFYWDTFNPPGNHFRVKFDDLVFFMHSQTTVSAPYFSGKAYMWADVCGQWFFLTGYNPAEFLSGSQDKLAELTTMPPVDVFLDSTDTMRVFTQGYDQEPFDDLYGVSVGKPAYSAGLDLVETIVEAGFNTFGAKFGDDKPGDNVDLGGALFDVGSASPSSNVGSHSAIAAANAFFREDFNVTYVPRPPIVSVFGAPANLGTLCTGMTAGRNVTITNNGEAPLHVSGVSMTGGGYSVTPGLPVPFIVAPGQVVDLNVVFHPTAATQGAGTLTIKCDDPLQPTTTYGFKALVQAPIITATANTARTPTMVVGTTTTWTVTITNTGTCDLSVKPSITGTGFSFVLPPSYYILGKLAKNIVVPPGGVNTDLTVVFTCQSVSTIFVGTLSLKSYDPVTPTATLVFGAEGVPVGMRVLVVSPDGTPYPSVDDIKLVNTATGVNTHLRDVPLTLIEPPASWKEIRYHYMTALPPTQDESGYELRVQVGNKKGILKFTLGAQEFKQLVITLD